MATTWFRSGLWLLSGFSFPLTAQTWTSDETVRFEADSVTIRNQGLSYDAQAQTLGLKADVRRQDAGSILSLNGASAWGRADSAAYSNLRLGSNLSVLGKQRSTSLLLQWFETRGNDPRQQPVEQALADDRGRFTSSLVGLFHQENLTVRDSLSLYASQSRNVDDGFPVLSRDLQLGLEQRESLASTYRVRVRRAEQDIDDAARVSQNELALGQTYQWTERLSTVWSAGYSQQKDEVETTNGAIGSLEIAYRTTAPFYVGSPYAEGNALRDISPDEIESLKGSSLYRAGWARSREVRRQGDPVVYTDQVFAQALIRIRALHLIDINLSGSRSPSEQNLALAQDYESRLASLFYRYAFTPAPRLVSMRAGFGLSDEGTSIGDLDYSRRIATLEIEARF